MRAAFRCWSTAARRAVHLTIDVQDLDCDFYIFTGHKLYGPTGIGVLYAKREHGWSRCRPSMGGGEMIREVSEETGSPTAIRRISSRRERPRSCLRSVSAPRSTTCNSIGKERIAAHEHDLVTYAMTGCGRSIRSASLAMRPGKGAVVSFEMKGAHPHDVATVIDRQRNRGSGRDPLRHAASGAIQRNGNVPGLIRHV
jgi:cysteine desulfurase/selenocysteine lyase